MFEQEIKNVLYNRADRLDVSAGAESRILAEINKMQDEMQEKTRMKENRKMKKFSVKLGVTVCALVCLSCATVMAATGIINGWASHNVVGIETGNCCLRKMNRQSRGCV